MLALHDGCVMSWLLFATVATVQDAWQLGPHVLGELRTGICAMCMPVAVVTSVVDVAGEEVMKLMSAV